MSGFANIIYEETASGIVLRALPILLFVVGVFAIAYRFYSAFLAARVLSLDDKYATPAHQLKDGRDYVPTNKWVLFGHHFAAISGAGTLIGPVLAVQYGYAPGLFWLVIGVCIAGAVQNMTVLTASLRLRGKTLIEIARQELGMLASIILAIASIAIVIMALAGMGFVLVKILAGEQVEFPQGTVITKPKGTEFLYHYTDTETIVMCPAGSTIKYTDIKEVVVRPEKFMIYSPVLIPNLRNSSISLFQYSKEITNGSSWAVFTIAATIPIALLVGFYLYRLRPGRVLEASILGTILVIGATIIGAWIPGSSLEPWFTLNKTQTVWALGIYTLIASILPVWMLLIPRGYLSSILKLGIIGLLIIGIVVANPLLAHPPVNTAFQGAGPAFEGGMFPFLFICIMSGAVSGFHSLVASGTTSKLLDKESQVRLIGYGSMLLEGMVAVVALIAAAALPVKLYYDINVPGGTVSKYQPAIVKMYQELGLAQPVGMAPLNQDQLNDLQHVDLSQLETMVGGDRLRGRTGGPATFAVSMALIFTRALEWTALPVKELVKYWYHFAIMFQALFFLTILEAGTRIARYLLQDMVSWLNPRFGQTNSLPGAMVTGVVVTVGWCWLVMNGSIQTIWPMLGVANQLLAVAALTVATSMLISRGKARYALVTFLPLLFVTATSMYAGGLLIYRCIFDDNWPSIALTFFCMVSIGLFLMIAVGSWVKMLSKKE